VGLYLAFERHWPSRKYEDGFLLSEVPLGEGFLDLQKTITTLRRAKRDCP